MTELSARNPRVTRLRRLLRRRRERTESGLFVVEGSGLVADALAAGAVPSDVFVARDADHDPGLLRALAAHDCAVWELDRSVFDAVATTATPQPVLATFPDIGVPLSAVLGAEPTFVVVGAGISDPGNAGTIIRTAAAAGADAVVFCDESVDVTNPKVVRASAAALFRIPVVRDAAVDDLFAGLADSGLLTVGLAGDAADDYESIDASVPTALVLGNEAHGLPPGIDRRLDRRVAIPMAAGVESINVAAAAAVVAFDIARQRRRP